MLQSNTIIQDTVMADERDGYPSSPIVWDSREDHSELRSPHDRPSFHSAAESVDEHATSQVHHPVPAPWDRSNGDSSSVNGHKSQTWHQPWRDNAPPTPIERRDTISSKNSGTPPSLVEASFDENVLRALCELDVSISLRCLPVLQLIRFLYAISAVSLSFSTASSKARCLVK